MKHKNIFKKAFTLAEIMIVLTIIGILTAILLPTTLHSTPDETILKFKKSQVVFANVVKELVTSAAYYKEGDLRLKPDGSDLSEAKDENYNYLCNAIGELVAIKAHNCDDNGKQTTVYCKQFKASSQTTCDTQAKFCNLAKAKERLDAICASITAPKGITTPDGVIWYEAAKTTELMDPDDSSCTGADCNIAYKVFCLKVNDKSFGFGIRSDGKIMAGAQADEYVKKPINQE